MSLRSKPSVILVLKYTNIFLGLSSSRNSMMVVLINFQMSKMHINSFKALNAHFNKFIPGKSKIESSKSWETLFKPHFRARIWYDGKRAFWSDRKFTDGEGNVTFICDMLRRGRTHDGSVTVPYRFSKEFPEVQLANLIRFMQNPEDSLVRPDYELILCIDYLLKVNIWAFICFIGF